MKTRSPFLPLLCLLATVGQSCLIARVDDLSTAGRLNLGFILSSLLGGCANPDRIAFYSLVDGDNEIYSIKTDGTEFLQLTFNAVSDSEPAWSPDARTIVFESNRSGNAGLYLIDADGSNERALLVDGFQNRQPVYATDGKGIYFVSTRAGAFQEIFYLDFASGQVFQITNSANTYDNISPAVSAGSDYIYFDTTLSGNDDIARIRKDGSGFEVIVSDINSDLEPTISPDGTIVLFSTDRDGNQEIYRSAADGSGQTNLSNDAGNDAAPYFSPDGANIAFASDRPISDLEIYTIGLSGSGLFQLTSNATLDSGPAWSCR